MFAVNNKDKRTTPVTSLLLNFVNIDILNIEQLSHFNSLLGRIISQTKTLKIKSFLPFNFAVIKISVAICLAEDRTRMGGL